MAVVSVGPRGQSLRQEGCHPSPTAFLAYITAPHSDTVQFSATTAVIMSDQNTVQNTVLQNIGSVGGAAYQTFVEFPYRAVTTQRLAELPDKDEQKMGSVPENTERHVQKDELTSPVSDELLKMLTSPDSVSTLLAQDPSLSPGEAWKKLYGHHIGKLGEHRPINDSGKRLASEEALRKAAEAGHWGPTQPSELFLRVRISRSMAKPTRLTDVDLS